MLKRISMPANASVTNVSTRKVRSWLDRYAKGLALGPTTAPPTRGTARFRQRQRRPSLNLVQEALLQHQQIAQEIMNSQEVTSVPKYDLRKFMFGPLQLARTLLVPRVDPLEPEVDSSPLEQVAQARQFAGQSVIDLINGGLMHQDPAVRSVIWLEAACLSDNLPAIPWILLADTTGSSALQHFHQVFVTGVRDVKYRQYRLTLLQHLLEAWSDRESGAINALHLGFGWSVFDKLINNENMTSLAGLARSVRRQYGQTLARLRPSPSRFLGTAFESGERRLCEAGLHIVQLLATTGFGVEALASWHALRDRAARILTLEDELVTLPSVIEGLIRVGYLEDAQGLGGRLQELLTLTSQERFSTTAKDAARRALVRLAAERGRFEEIDKMMAAEGKAISALEGLARRAVAAGKRNDIESVKTFVNKALSIEDGLSLQQRARLLGVLLSAHARRNDLESAVSVLDQMMSQGLRPSLEHVAAILFGYAARHDIDAVYALYRRLQEGEFKLGPDVTCSNAVVTVHCRLQDIAGAQGAIKRMQDAGLDPNLQTWTTLMNACVEVGDWKKAAGLFAFLEGSQDPSLRPDTATFNVAIKAAVYSSATVQSVLRLFRQMSERGLRANATTYTLVLQSVCNAGIMDVAEDLFRSIDSQTQEARQARDLDVKPLPVSMKPVKPDVFHFSCLASGYIRTGEMAKARACLAEMRRRKIGPSSVTYGIIVDSFLRVATRANAERASKFAMDFIASSPLDSIRYSQAARLDRALARGDELVNVFAPILRNHVKRGRADVALATFRVVLDAGAKPSIELYTILMDAYRRGDNVSDAASNVFTVWQGVHDSVLSAFGTGAEEARRIDESQAHALCVPLNILIDALSRDGRIGEIDRQWHRLDQQGFAFDCANWNAFAIALIEDAKLERACWIVENILLRQNIGPDAEGTESSSDSTRGRRALQAPAKMPSRARRSLTQAYDQDTDDLSNLSLLDELSVVSSEMKVGEADDDDAASTSVIDEVVKAQQARIGASWFPFASLLSRLDNALQQVAQTQAAGSIQAQRRVSHLKEHYPATFDQVSDWRHNLYHKRQGDVLGGQASMKRAAFVV
ncbi:hypothetical protein OIO90_000865 [Microbotryomycetes sp. JL221]|nr:hypothetical protein OIO90_000865 [Microbotryomycetes sp. JL221]